ncbi:uncharacterized protein TNCV_39631 [Trichonephila clavipes]|nr:uncharacterized protein TNCV_39631 [Trichonephila clavipes]
MRNLPYRRTQRPKINKIIPCKTISGPPVVLTGEGIKLPCVFEAVREIYRNIFGFARFEKVDRFRSEIQLAGHPLKGLKCERKLGKEAGKRKRVDLSVSSRKKKTQLSISAENSTADPENIFLPPKQNESAFQKAYKTFNLPNNDSSLVKESEDFEGRDSGWTLDEILRLEVRTNRYSPFRGSSSFIEVPKQIAETKAIINVINKKDSQCFMWSILAALYPNTSNPNKTSSYVSHLNKLNFDGISFPTPLNEVKKFSKMNDIGINIYSFEEDLKIFPLLSHQ